MYIVKYDSKEIGSVVSNRPLTNQEIVRLAGVDIEGDDPHGSPWAWELFEIESVTQEEYNEYQARKAAACMGRKGGKSTTEAKRQAARTNGRKGGRPKKVK